MDYSETLIEKFTTFLSTVMTELCYRNEMIHLDNTGDHLTVETDGSTQVTLRRWNKKGWMIAEAEVLIDESESFIVTDSAKKLSIVSAPAQAVELIFPDRCC